MCVCFTSASVAVWLLGWRRDRLSSWHIQWSFFSGYPLCQRRIYTLVTQILWHTRTSTSYPCAVSTCNPDHPCPLLPLFSSFLIFLSVCAVIGRSFVIQQIPSSNLFMVVVDNKCDCSVFEPITMNPIEIMYILHWSKTWGMDDWTWGLSVQILVSCYPEWQERMVWKHGSYICWRWGDEYSNSYSQISRKRTGN